MCVISVLPTIHPEQSRGCSTNVFIDEVGCSLESKAGPRSAPVGSSALACGGWIFIDLERAAPRTTAMIQEPL